MSLQKEAPNTTKQLVTLGLALQALREEDTADGLIRITLDYLKSEFQYALTWLGLYDRVGHQLLGKGGSCATGDTNFFKRRFTLQPGDLLEQVVMQRSPLAVPNLQEDARAGEWSAAAQRFNIQGSIVFPIHHKNTAFGLILLGSALWGTSPHAEEKVRLSMILGELAKSLYLIEEAQQRQQTKRPDQPLLNLLPKLRSLPDLKKRLEAIIDETHRFVAPTRTQIFWYEPERRYFWKRLASKDKGFTTGEAKQTQQEIAVQDINSFYHAMTADQLVVVGESEGSLRADLTGRLMQQIQARSLIAAPILFQGELLGFLSVEGQQPRLWTEDEKSFVRGAAQLVALTAPLDQMETTIQQVKLDQRLTAEVSRALYSEEEWRNSLKICADQVCQRLNVERFLILLYNKDLKKFEVCYQNQLGKRKPIPNLLEPINPVDWQMLERSLETIAIENLEEDLKLMAWRKIFLDLGLRSLLVCSTATGKPLEALVIVGHEATRSWSHTERDLLRTVSQQMGLLMHQMQLQRQTDQLQKNYQAVQWGLTTMQQTPTLERLEAIAMQQIAQVLQAPLVVLIAWQAGKTLGHLTAPVIKNQQKMGLTADLLIPLTTDKLTQAALQADGLVELSGADITPETRYWLSGSEIGRVLAIALRTAPNHEPTGIIVIGDRQDCTWSDRQFSVLGLLASQLAWSRRHLLLTQSLLTQKQNLEHLNWYKQRRLEEVYRILGSGVRRLNELSNHQDSTANLRSPMILRHLGSTLSAMTPLLKHEQWQFHDHYETIPIASLLKRALERADAAIKQRQLWFQVHNEANLNLGGDIAKIEFVFHEILMAACARSPVGGRLDIWCRQKDANFLDLSVTDHGILDLELAEAIHTGRPEDLLAPSLLDAPPGLHLAICRAMMQRMGGELNLYSIEDGRVLSGLLIPLLSSPPTVKQF